MMHQCHHQSRRPRAHRLQLLRPLQHKRLLPTLIYQPRHPRRLSFLSLPHQQQPQPQPQVRLMMHQCHHQSKRPRAQLIPSQHKRLLPTLIYQPTHPRRLSFLSLPHQQQPQPQPQVRLMMHQCHHQSKRPRAQLIPSQHKRLLPTLIYQPRHPRRLSFLSLPHQQQPQPQVQVRLMMHQCYHQSKRPRARQLRPTRLPQRPKSNARLRWSSKAAWPSCTSCWVAPITSRSPSALSHHRPRRFSASRYRVQLEPRCIMLPRACRRTAPRPLAALIELAPYAT